jgi:Sigma-70 region 2
VDDRSLVAALRSGQLRGLAGIYDGYGDRLLAYALTLTPDAAAADEAVHDALLVARERADRLPDEDRLRPWLYALVRNECVRGRRERRSTAPMSSDSEVRELTGRHELSEAELAAVLGVSAATAADLTARVREDHAGVPFELAPPELRERVLAHAGPAEYPRRLAERAGPWRADGFPVPLARPRRLTGPDLRRSPLWWSAAALAVVAVLITTGLALRPGPGTLTGTASERLPTALPAGDRLADDDSGTGGAPGPSSPGPATSPSGPTSGPAGPTGSSGSSGPAGTSPAQPSEAATPTGSAAPTGRPTTAPATAIPPPTTPPVVPTTLPPPTTTPAPVPAVATRWSLVAPACPKNWRARLTATVTGTVATAVTAGFTGGGGVPPRAAMTESTPGVWTLAIILPAGRRLTWTATATTAAGPLVSPARALSYTCA